MRSIILDAVAGRELELAQRYCGITEGKRKDKEHHQACPVCREGMDRFWFYPERRTFHCRVCNFGGNIIDLMMTVNAITYRKALDTIANEVGIVLPEKTKKMQRAPLRVVWEQNRNDDRMTIAMLVLAHVRFVPGTDGVNFLAASIETTRKYASRLTEHPINAIARLLAIEKYQGDMQKAWVVLECLYMGKDITDELRKHNVNRIINEIRWLAQSERHKFEKEMEIELERKNNANT